MTLLAIIVLYPLYSLNTYNKLNFDWHRLFANIPNYYYDYFIIKDSTALINIVCRSRLEILKIKKLCHLLITLNSERPVQTRVSCTFYRLWSFQHRFICQDSKF